MSDIILNNITKSFDNITLFNGLNAVVPAGKCTVITGKSGAGKTTLLRIIMNLDKNYSGSVTGNEGRFSAVFQEDRLCRSLSVNKNLKLICNNNTLIDYYLEELEISDVKYNNVEQISGGQKRRVAIARALLSSYDKICMDEAFTGIDSSTKEKVIRFVASEISGKTAIISTHDEMVIQAFGENRIDL